MLSEARLTAEGGRGWMEEQEEITHARVPLGADTEMFVREPRGLAKLKQHEVGE